MATYPINLFGSRVKDSATTTGTGNFTLAGSAPTRFVTFGSRFALTQRFGYAIIHDSANEWEDGIGYLSASTTLVRERPLHGSSGDYTLVNFSSGNKTVFFSSHMISEAEKVCDRVGILHAGKLVSVVERRQWQDRGLEPLFIEATA